MELTTVNQTIQYIAWFIALGELIIAVYIFTLNPRQTANRHVSITLTITAISTYALGMLLTAVSMVQAQVSANILAMTVYAVQPALLLTSVAMLQPDWLQGKKKWVWWPFYGLIILPAALTLIDSRLGNTLWYSGIDPATYIGGYIPASEFTNGSISILVRAGAILSLAITSVLLLYTAVFEKSTTPGNRNLAWMLLLPQFLAGAALFYFPAIILPSVFILITNTVIASCYAFAAFKQMIAEQHPQRGSLQIRLTTVVLVISLPLIVALTAFLVDRAQRIVTSTDNNNPGLVYIVNAEDKLIAHTNGSHMDDSLDFSRDPAVTKLRQGYMGPYTDTDSDGIRWRTKGELLANGWGMIVKTPEKELLGPLMNYRRLAWITLATAILLVLILSILMIRYTIYPVRSLIRITTAVAAGDLSLVAPVHSEDEIGALARSFNSLTYQVSDLISGLEESVTERTHDLERRAAQLQVAAEVAKEAAAIRDLSSLLEQTVTLISDRFGFYHAGIFIIDDARQYAVLSAASSEGGQQMLAQDHQLRVGKVGIVGHVAASGEPRIALDVGDDAVFFNNPDLPQTHSEMAIPMKSHGIVVGVLDVQSKETTAFSEEDIDILQVLADQIALAIENTRLLQAKEKALDDLAGMFKLQVGQAWAERLEDTHIDYSYDRLGVHPIESDSDQSEILNDIPELEQSAGYGENNIAVPIVLHGNQIGSLRLHRDDNIPWTREDREIVDVIMSQMSLALNNARIQESERLRSEKDQMVNKISTRTQSSLDLETVMKRAVQEIGQAFKAEKVQIMLGTNGDPSNNGGTEQ